MANRIFTSANFNSNKTQSTNANGSYYKNNRLNLITENVARELNTYRNWNTFALALPKIWDDEGKLSVQQDEGIGKKSLFSPVAAVYSDKGSIRQELNIPLLDTPEARQYIRQRTDCSIKSLVENPSGRSVYNYSDFMYCKYLGRIPNNYMITLRKFPLPCSDHINCSCDEEEPYNKHLPDMGRLVTWLGTPDNDMSNILKYSYSMSFTENKAPMDDEVSVVGSDGGGSIGQMFSAIDGSYAKQLHDTGGMGYDNNSWAASRLGGNFGGMPRNLDLKDSNHIFAERQNIINSVWVPGKKDEGLTFNQEIKVTFDYELRSYDGINGKSAFLDLLANILMVTYLQGKFFPGSYRSTAMSRSGLYTNLDIFKNVDATKSPGAFVSSMFTSIKQAATGLGFTKDNIKESLKNLGQNLFEVMANGLINKMGRTQAYAMTSFITPTPTGQWHLTVGNPRNPILSIGNLILTGADIEHYGPLGIDDFPTGLKVTVILKHAKPRDSVAIEQMYMQGDNRIYVPMGENIEDMYKDATTVNKATDDTAIWWPAQKDKSTRASKEKNTVFEKYFGTRDVKAITLTSKEALTGAEKSNKKK